MHSWKIPQVVLALVGWLAVWQQASVAWAQTNGEELVNTAAGVLNEIMNVPAKEIPQSLLSQSQGIAIIPNVVKGGFVVGARHGKGVVMIRDDQGNWSPPRFVSLTGGSIGWQAGVQATDVVLVFRSRSSINGLLRGKLTIGADAAASAGPVGRNLSAGTDAQLKSEIYSYSRSRGLFLGVALDGSAIQVDPVADAAYYRNIGPNGAPVGALPDSAVRLMELVNRYSGTATLGPQTTHVPPPELTVVPGVAGPSPTEKARVELATSANQLYPLLDNAWRSYLALPRPVFVPDQPPDLGMLKAALARWEAVTANPQYRPLAERTEFQAAIGQLRTYIQLLEQPGNGQLPLPPPPGG